MGGECHPGSEACLYSCGLNLQGQCGINLDGDSTIEQFTLVSDIKNPKEIACGDHHSLVIDGDNTLYACGNNSQGQLGLGSTTNRTKFTKVKNSESFTNENIIGIACGDKHSFCVDSNHHIYSCGDNSQGQLGLGATGDRALFTKVTEIVTDIEKYGNKTPITNNIIENVKISCGSSHTLLILTSASESVGNQSVYSCGNNDDGQLGLVIPEEINTDYNTFAKVPNNSVYFTNEGVLDISCGNSHSLLMQNNTLYGAGSHNKGQLGLGIVEDGPFFEFQKIDHTSDFIPPIDITFEPNQLSSMSYHNMILVDVGAANKAIYGCGEVNTEEDTGANKLNLGDVSGEVVDTFKLNIDAQLNSGSKISTGIEHSLVIDGDGTLYSTGSNINNQLGFLNNDTNSKKTFQEVPHSDDFTNEDVSDISCGGYHSLIIVSP